MKTDAIAFLKKQHKEVKEVFAKIEKTKPKDGKKREALFAEVKQMLDLHTSLEETYLYPILKDKKLTHDITLEAYVEHDVAKSLLTQLETEEKGTDEWMAKCIVAKEVVEHHVKEEESDFFSKVKKVLSKEELDGIGEAMALFTKKETRM